MKAILDVILYVLRVNDLYLKYFLAICHGSGFMKYISVRHFYQNDLQYPSEASHDLFTCSRFIVQVKNNFYIILQ